MSSQNGTVLDMSASWQSVLRDAVRDPAELAALLNLPPEAIRGGAAAAHDFPLLVPRGFVARMRPGDPTDPLLAQVLPDARETATVAGFGPDPVGESRFSAGGIVRKYSGRALIVTTAACPVHCRYCFRRAFPYGAHNAARDDWRPALEAIRAQAGVTEVILSGGDPLSLGDARLGRLIDRIAAIAHVDTLRIHTRFPIMVPERITTELLDRIAATRLTVVVVVHVNHPNEIDDTVAAALGRLHRSATALLNQSVLLRAVNDDVDTLSRLSRRLIACGVLPYYLHALDRIAGSAHFLVPDARGIELVDGMRARLPGYLVPRFVRELAGELSKSPIVQSL